MKVSKGTLGIAIIVSIGGFLFGFDAAVISGVNSFITAEFDPLRGEGEAYAQKLAGAGVDARSERYDGVFHPFSMLHKALPEGMQSIQSAAAFARKHLSD